MPARYMLWPSVCVCLSQDVTKLSCLCRVRFGGMNWIPDKSRLSPTEHLKSKHVNNTHTRTHTRLTALFPELLRWAGTRKAKPIWILLKQETVSGSGISWNICKSAPRSRQITMPAPHHSVFYWPDALPAAQPTASKHWRHVNSNCPIYTATPDTTQTALSCRIWRAVWIWH